MSDLCALNIILNEWLLVWMYPIVIGGMYISPPNSKYEKINLKDERIQLGPVWIWFLTMFMVEHVSFFIELFLFCFALGWACCRVLGWAFVVLDWTCIIFAALLVERVVVLLVEGFYFLIELALFCFTLSWTSCCAIGWVFLVLGWTCIIFFCSWLSMWLCSWLSVFSYWLNLYYFCWVSCCALDWTLFLLCS